ncbi:chromosomal replication initiator DnaA [Limibaculum sp. M0105]|uniref:Chromosomal replication initiator DnaA n=1 Tax=Thermohalobaculum xanthum TaxID=2753746 RepID=A0A8J7M4W8_9RHOB|nr:DnaA/Hda family protein [Thermohalobaculum xanthum]MBK0398376.1 chromosomal replication initiator DnaA [Thermohalobaculum xanthum]
MARQMPLDLAHRPALGRGDFLVSQANAQAVALIDAWRDWPGGRLALIGPASSGKTHLAHVWMAESGAARIEAADLGAGMVPGLAAQGSVVVEDADRLAGLDPEQRRAAEGALFHLLNLVAAEGGRLLVTGRTPPASWSIDTPDLASRLQSLALARISAPDDMLLSSVMIKLFADRQLPVMPEVVNYLVERIDRSFAAAERAVAGLDAHALGERRRISRRLAAEYLGEVDDTDETGDAPGE